MLGRDPFGRKLEGGTFWGRGSNLNRAKPNPWSSNMPNNAGVAQPNPSYSYQYQSMPGGGMQVRRETAEQAANPSLGSRVYNVASVAPGSQIGGFPWQARRGISSDASRQAAFRTGLSSGEGRGGFVRKSADSVFDPRIAFDPAYQRWQSDQRLRRFYGL